jgi:hypothetical protein
MKFYIVYQKELSNRACRIRMLDREEVIIFSESVHNDKNDRIAIRQRQTLYEVHGNAGLRKLRN